MMTLQITSSWVTRLAHPVHEGVRAVSNLVGCGDPAIHAGNPIGRVCSARDAIHCAHRMLTNLNPFPCAPDFGAA
jgi:hypothetical protein